MFSVFWHFFYFEFAYLAPKWISFSFLAIPFEFAYLPFFYFEFVYFFEGSLEKSPIYTFWYIYIYIYIYKGAK